MKEHKLLSVGIIGIFVSLIYLGLLYQSGEILNAIISIDASSWNMSASYFVNPISLTLGICCLVGAVACCIIDIILVRRKPK